MRMKTSKRVVVWLSIVSVMIFSMIMVGGITRLTNSGLSMVDWKPIMGALPPMNHEQWVEAFDAYKKYPEFQKVNQNMDLAGFKFIYFWEYIHRLLGRTIGLVFLLPLIVFWYEGRIKKPLFTRLSLIFVLGGMQGLLGWYMVKSGLVDLPHVSHFRLTSHLLLAILLYGAVVWTLFDRFTPEKIVHKGPPKWSLFYSYSLLVLIVVQIGYGGMVAGLKAGFAYNTFPKMAGQWVPTTLMTLEPYWSNFVNNPAIVQFVHRAIAWAIFFMVVLYWGVSFDRFKYKRMRVAVHLLLGMVCLQFLLGVMTLVLQVPLILGVLHQMGGVLLLTNILYILHIQIDSKRYMVPKEEPNLMKQIPLGPAKQPKKYKKVVYYIPERSR